MRFLVLVADRETGEESTIELERPTVQEARNAASEAGYLVSKVDVVNASGSGQPKQIPSLACPKCGSEQTQSLSILHQSGTTDVRTNGRLKATANPWLWPVPHTTIRGGIQTTGTHQTELARLVAPPAKPQVMLTARMGLCILVTGLAMLTVVIWRVNVEGECWGITTGILFACAIGVVGAVVYAVFGFQARRAPMYLGLLLEYERRIEEWNKEMLCNRCSHKFTPEL